MACCRNGAWKHYSHINFHVNENRFETYGSLREPILETYDHSKCSYLFLILKFVFSNLLNLDSLKLSASMTFLGLSIKKNNTKVTCHLKKGK